MRKTILIKDNEFSIKLLPARRGFVLGMELIKVFLPALAAYYDGINKEEFILPEENTLFSDVAVTLVAHSDRLDIAGIVVELTEGVMKNNSEVDVDVEFAGKYGDFLVLIEGILRENFSDFFTEYLKEKGLEIPWSLRQTNQQETSSE